MGDGCHLTYIFERWQHNFGLLVVTAILLWCVWRIVSLLAMAHLIVAHRWRPNACSHQCILLLHCNLAIEHVGWNKCTQQEKLPFWCRNIETLTCSYSCTNNPLSDQEHCDRPSIAHQGLPIGADDATASAWLHADAGLGQHVRRSVMTNITALPVQHHLVKVDKAASHIIACGCQTHTTGRMLSWPATSIRPSACFTFRLTTA